MNTIASGRRPGEDEGIIPRARLPAWLGYLAVVLAEVALVSILIAVYPFFPAAELRIPFILITGGAAYLLGSGPAVLSILVGTLAYTYVYVLPMGAIRPLATSPSDWAQLAMLLLGMLVAAAAMLTIRRLTSRLAQTLSDVRQNEELLGTVLEAVPVGVVFADVEGNITYTSPGTSRILGGPASGVVMGPEPGTFEFLNPDGTPFRPEEMPLLRAIRSGEPVYAVEMLIRQAEGREVAVTVDTRPVRDESGRVVGAVASLADITERRKAEERLAKNLRDMEILSASATRFLEPMSSAELFQYTAQRLRVIAGRAIIAVSEYNPSTNQLTIRAIEAPADKLPRIPELFDRDPIGMNLMVAKGTRERMAGGRLDHVEGGLCDLVFYQLPSPLCERIERELRIGLSYAMPYFLGDDFMGMVAVMTDQDEGLVNRELIEAIVNQTALALKRTRVEEALRRTQARFRATFDRAGIGMTVVDMHGNVLEANPAFSEFVGYSQAELIGMNVKRYAYQPDLEHGNELLREMIEGKRDSYQVEKRYVTRDGRIVWGRLTASIARNPEPEPPFIIGMIEDITRQKLAEQREREREEEMLEFYRRTILAATEGKLEITDRDEICRLAGEPVAAWDLESPQELSSIRHQIADVVREYGLAEDRADGFVMAVGEALTNAVKHAMEGRATLHRLPDALMLVVTDQGPGIPSLSLPDVALTKGYSTVGTLGMGYKYMISFADKVYLSTGPRGTTVGLEISMHPTEKLPFGLSIPGITAKEW